jgi:hypothetical protein
MTARARPRDLFPRRRRPGKPSFFTPYERCLALGLGALFVVLAVLDILGVIG